VCARECVRERLRERERERLIQKMTMALDTPTPPYNASDPFASFFNVSCLDLLLIEMVPLAERMARRAEKMEAGEIDVDGEGEDEGDVDAVVAGNGNGKGSGRGEKDDVGAGEVYQDAIFFRLDALGYRVGQGLSERCVFFFSFFNELPPCSFLFVDLVFFTRRGPSIVDEVLVKLNLEEWQPLGYCFFFWGGGRRKHISGKIFRNQQNRIVYRGWGEDPGSIIKLDLTICTCRRRGLESSI
jgi:trafficking protein particle complex subunit 6